MSLYPLTFAPIYKSKIWGGNKFRTVLHKSDAPSELCGESWEISGLESDCSVVSNGDLAGNTLNELIDIYMDDLVGSKVLEKYDHEFPLLIKLLDVTDLLSLQVHPNDVLAEKRHNSAGKTEMWYVIQAEDDADLTVGFNKPIDRDTFIEYVVTNRLPELFNVSKTQSGDAYFIPAGLVHGGGKGLLIAEIQQTSDITYRIFDWDRKDADGNARDLHIDMALDALDYSSKSDYRSAFDKNINEPSQVVKCDYFAVNRLEFNNPFDKDYSLLDSFVIYICLNGEFFIQYDNLQFPVKKGQTVLIPAKLDKLQLIPTPQAEILEVYVP